MRIETGLLFGLMLAAIGPAGVYAAADAQRTDVPRVYEHVLDNGLRVLVKPDHRAPVVVSQMWYKVGGSYEPKGRTGISHVLEHMMFKGTMNFGPGEFSRIIAEQGGRDNAFTGKDYTAYFQTLEKSKLEIAFKLEADRMRNLEFDPAEFTKELEVVKEERRLRTDDSPQSRTYEKFMATAYTESNYRNPIIGWPDDLDSMELRDVRAWYDTHYVPGNATLVVVGDVEPEPVFELAQRYFGRVPARKPSSPTVLKEPPQTAERRVEVRLPANVPYLMIGYHVPVIASVDESDQWEPYALEVAAYLLDGGKSTRLPTELVRRQQVASSIDVSYDSTGRGASLFVISANPASAATLERLETAVKDQIRKMGTDLASAAELDRVKNQLVASKVYEADSSFYQGMRLGSFEASGLPWQLSQTMEERLQSVTAEQVRAVVRKYLVDDNSTVAFLRPQTSSEG